MILAALQRVGGGRSRRRASAAAAAAVVMALSGVCAAPAFAAPQWELKMSHANAYGAQKGLDPFTGSGETFARESGQNTYTLTVSNPGPTTSGPVTVKDRLPAGIVLQNGGLDGTKQEDEVTHGPEWECTVSADGSEVTCTTSKPLETLKAYSPITLHVYVNPVTPLGSSPPNVANVTGGGNGNTEATAEEKTTVTQAVPFGVNSFTTAFVKEEEIENPKTKEKERPPETQAGGHPFEFTTRLVFNYTPGASASEPKPPATGLTAFSTYGGPKEVSVDLPPGFVGNPQNTPRCPLELLSGAGCPANTAVGFVHISTGAEITGGKAKTFQEPFFGSNFNSLVWNMQPTPGHVVALGLVVLEGTPIVLEGKVRSDGDYGVTVSNPSPRIPSLNGAIFTTCGNGAVKVSPVGNFACQPAPSGSKPFLTNPTACSSLQAGQSAAPVTTLRSNPWNGPVGEPPQYASMEAYANAPSGPYSEPGRPTRGTPEASSLMTGCDQLSFSPEIDFKQSAPAEGGTSQADEPTGMRFSLKLPQSNEAQVKATPALKNLKMALPAGMTVSPSAADGLQACSNAQFGLGTEFGPGSAHSEPAKPASCPLASQIGEVEVFTPLLSGAPVIEGVPGSQQGGHGLLTCSQGSWANGPTKYSYQWLRSGQAIPGATTQEYVPVVEDKEKALQCQVTAANDQGGSSVAVSRDVVGLPEPEASKQPPFPPSSVRRPSGTPSPGSTLTCATEAWTGAPALTYRWLRGGSEIAGAEGSSYPLGSEDAGKAVQCQVRGTNAGGTVIADSAAVVVSPVPSPPPPLPGGPLQGQLFVGEPECSPCTNEDAQSGKLFRLFLQIQDPRDGLIVKLHGVNHANPVTGQLETEFLEQPQVPFELLELKLKGGPRAPLANPQSCGATQTSADLTPWSAPGLGGLTGSEQIAGTPDAILSSPLNVDFDGAGGACPGALPFSPSFNAGTTGAGATSAGAYTQFSVTFSRQDREQNLSGVQVQQPPGLAAKLASVPLCEEPRASAGTCGPESQIGTTTTGAGAGEDPFFVKGRVYLTGPYKGAPFGLSIVVPAVAGPFNLGNVVVRSAISVDPRTAAATVTSDPLPQILDGVPFRLRKVNVEINRPGFIFNPTNCSAHQITATLSSDRGANAQVASPFGIGGCQNLPFHPELSASAGGRGSKAGGTSFTVKVKSSPGQANIGKTFLQLPSALPSRLSTIQKACLAATFEANPASCPEGSNIGMAIAHTPVLKNPLAGPAYLVSHGNAAFPDVEFVLQGEGITLVLDGKTDIKKGITYSRFETVPDAPVDTFETIFPAGPHSALTANVPESEHFSLCNTTLLMPTEITGQNGAVIKQTTHIAVTGCPPSVTITSAKVKGNALLVTFKTAGAGTAWVSGFGLRKAHRHVTAGTHRIRVTFTKLGMRKHKHHQKTSVRVKLVVGKQAVTRARTVRL
jgi:uncharacterized repeat protein (TIGR01451 family)